MGKAGGDGGFSTLVTIDRNECINEVTLRSGLYVDGLTFKYKGGKEIKIGGNGGNEDHLHFGNACVIGVTGRAYDYIDAIGFVTAELANS